jgi:hypothetical protein
LLSERQPTDSGRILFLGANNVPKPPPRPEPKKAPSPLPVKKSKDVKPLTIELWTKEFTEHNGLTCIWLLSKDGGAMSGLTHGVISSDIAERLMLTLKELGVKVHKDVDEHEVLGGHVELNALKTASGKLKLKLGGV